jgi:small GTP-binding protein
MDQQPSDDQQNEELDEMVFKVLIVGEPGVGKTSLVKRYVNDVFTTRYKSTIGADFAYKTIFKTITELEDGKEVSKNYKITLQLWDLAGQERIGTQVNVFYRQTDGVLCVSDVTRDTTKNQVLLWKQAVMENSTNKIGEQNFPPCVLLFNKMDLFGTTQVWNFGELVPVVNDNNNPVIETDPDLISVEITLDEDQTTVIERPRNNGNGSLVMPNIITVTKDEKREDEKRGDEKKGKKSNKKKFDEDKRYETNDSIKPYMDFACTNDFIAGVPVSAKAGVGIDYAIKLLLNKMIDRRLTERDDETADGRVKLRDVLEDQNRGYCGYC